MSATTLDQIVAVMRDRTLADDLVLSEIQDVLTIAGYDVPLRSYDPATTLIPHRVCPTCSKPEGLDRNFYCAGHGVPA